MFYVVPPPRKQNFQLSLDHTPCFCLCFVWVLSVLCWILGSLCQEMMPEWHMGTSKIWDKLYCSHIKQQKDSPRRSVLVWSRVKQEQSGVGDIGYFYLIGAWGRLGWTGGPWGLDGVCVGSTFPSAPKEEACGLSYSVSQTWGNRVKGEGWSIRALRDQTW